MKDNYLEKLQRMNRMPLSSLATGLLALALILSGCTISSSPVPPNQGLGISSPSAGS